MHQRQHPRHSWSRIIQCTRGNTHDTAIRIIQCTRGNTHDTAGPASPNAPEATPTTQPYASPNAPEVTPTTQLVTHHSMHQRQHPRHSWSRPERRTDSLTRLPTSRCQQHESIGWRGVGTGQNAATRVDWLERCGDGTECCNRSRLVGEVWGRDRMLPQDCSAVSIITLVQTWCQAPGSTQHTPRHWHVHARSTSGRNRFSCRHCTCLRAKSTRVVEYSFPRYASTARRLTPLCCVGLFDMTMSWHTVFSITAHRTVPPATWARVHVSNRGAKRKACSMHSCKPRSTRNHARVSYSMLCFTHQLDSGCTQHCHTVCTKSEFRVHSIGRPQPLTPLTSFIRPINLVYAPTVP